MVYSIGSLVPRYILAFQYILFWHATLKSWDGPGNDAIVLICLVNVVCAEMVSYYIASHSVLALQCWAHFQSILKRW